MARRVYLYCGSLCAFMLVTCWTEYLYSRLQFKTAQVVYCLYWNYAMEAVVWMDSFWRVFGGLPTTLVLRFADGKVLWFYFWFFSLGKKRWAVQLSDIVLCFIFLALSVFCPKSSAKYFCPSIVLKKIYSKIVNSAFPLLSLSSSESLKQYDSVIFIWSQEMRTTLGTARQ